MKKYYVAYDAHQNYDMRVSEEPCIPSTVEEPNFLFFDDGEVYALYEKALKEFGRKLEAIENLARKKIKCGL